MIYLVKVCPGKFSPWWLLVLLSVKGPLIVGTDYAKYLCIKHNKEGITISVDVLVYNNIFMGILQLGEKTFRGDLFKILQNKRFWFSVLLFCLIGQRSVPGLINCSAVTSQRPSQFHVECQDC